MRSCRRIVPPSRKELRVTPVKLCNDISRLCHARLRSEGEMDGVLSQPGARAILSMIAVSDGLCQRELVKETHLRPPTVSIILQKMEEAGMVERQSDPDDRRIIRVRLTEYGREMDAQTIERIRRNDARAMAGLSEEETTVLLRLLERIRDNLLVAEEESKEGEGEKA